MPKQRELSLSPSELHLRLMRDTRPAMAFRGGDVRAWQRKLRRKLAELTGFDTMPTRRPALRVRSLWKRRHELGTIEKIAFVAEPGSDALAYVCLPDPRKAKPPHTFVVCVQGHTTGMHWSIGVERDDESKPFAVEGDRDFAIGAMRHGFAALCIEQRAFGGRREQLQKQRAEHPCHDAVFHALMLGRTLIAERVYDVDRGIDYLATRGDADMSRVGIMGNSGGGTTSLYSAALLPRIAFAMPSCVFCTYGDSAMRIYHCGDNYVPGILRYAEIADVLGLAAPKPVLVVAGEQDDIFPITGTKKAFRDLKKIYAAAGAAERCALHVGAGGHRFYAEAWPKLVKMIGGV